MYFHTFVRLSIDRVRRTFRASSRFHLAVSDRRRLLKRSQEKTPNSRPPRAQSSKTSTHRSQECSAHSKHCHSLRHYASSSKNPGSSTCIRTRVQRKRRSASRTSV